MRILVLSSIKPSKDSGGPSSLLWMCLEALNKKSTHVELKVICETKLAIFKKLYKLSRLGILSKKLEIANESYDYILVFPFYLAININRKHRSNLIVLGPDSCSLLFARTAKTSTNIFSKFKYGILYRWFLLKEKEILSDCVSLMVVGQNDRRWLMGNVSTYTNDKLTYLPHPVLMEVVNSSNIRHIDRIHIKPGQKTIIFSGDLDEKYVGKLIHDSIFYLEKICNKYNSEIVVLGKKNYWVYNLLLSSKIDRNSIKCIDWVENYNEICDPQRHIHVVPLVNGAGTKNRVLTACALGVSVVTTPVGFENIFYYKPVNLVKKFSRPEILYTHLEFLISKADKSIETSALLHFSESINFLFESIFLDQFHKDIGTSNLYSVG